MANPLVTYDRYSGALKKLLLVTGLWPVVNPSVFYRLISFVNIAAELWLAFSIFNFARLHMANFKLLIGSLGLGLGFLISTQKMISLKVHRDRLLDLQTSLQAGFSRDLEDPELRPILLSPMLTYYRPSLFFAIVAYTLCALYVTAPIRAIMIQLIHGANEIKCILPMPTAYPWSIGGTNKWFFSIVYGYEFYIFFCITCVASSVDGLFGFYIFQIAGQLRTISYRLRTLKSNENYQEIIKECVSRHQILMRCQAHLEQIWGPIVLSITVLNAMIMCAFIWQISHMDPRKAVTFIIFIITKAIQSLFYGWFGSTLTTENDKLREAIYAIDWPGSGHKSLMTSVLTMISCSKPIVLRACSVGTISVDMFVAVCNTAVSYYFMLRTLEDHKSLES
ncbi:odorant receptor 67a-like [Venturia canescens]|uniref:odorant receptor 67a-like n=1 Tax=Venturia canescens TaxID=32260 RepID=UPI001C9D4DF8|nr:odorant receptor 67a-like [Venturia canescens]